MQRQFNFSKIPSFYIACLFAVGIVIEKTINDFDLTSSLALFYTSSIAISLGILLRKTNSTIQTVLIFICIIAAGINLTNTKQAYLSQWKLATSKQQIIGTITSDPKKSHKYLRFYLEAEKVNIENKWKINRSKLLTYVHLDSLSESLRKGDQIHFESRILNTQKNKNPSSFDFSEFLAIKGISQQCFVKTNQWTLLRRQNFSWWKKCANGLRDYGLGVFAKTIPNQASFGLLSALVLGDRRNLQDKTYQSYQETGAMHVLAVSGLHVGILSQILLSLFGLVQNQSTIWEWAKAILIILCIWFFALLTGNSPSVMRAAMMFSLFTMGKIFFKSSSSINTIGVTALLLLCFDPFLLFDLGFQLSFLALIGIVFFHPLISKLIQPKNNILKMVWDLSCLSISAQVLVFPLIISSFNQFPIYFILSGLLAVPFAAILLNGGLILIIFNIISEKASIGIGKLINLFAEYFIYGIELIQQLPFNLIGNLYLSKLEMGILYLFLICIMLYLDNRKIIFCLFGLLFFGSFLSLKNYEKYDSLHQNCLVLYHHKNGLIADYFLGQQCYELNPSHITEEELTFINQDNRLSKKIEEVIKIDFAFGFDSPHIKLNKEQLNIGTQRLIYLNDQFNVPKDIQFEAEYLLIEKMNLAKLAKELSRIHADQIVLLASIPIWEIKKYRALLGSKNFYSISDNGALTIEI